jgi:hypothetical protein
LARHEVAVAGAQAGRVGRPQHHIEPAAVSYIHIHAPAVAYFAAVNACPTCERPRRMLGAHAEWYGTTWTCVGCGDRWQDGERLERPFCQGWRRQNIEHARRRLAAIGVQA